jgi:hypothetical protein
MYFNDEISAKRNSWYQKTRFCKESQTHSMHSEVQVYWTRKFILSTAKKLASARENSSALF